ncbi:4714_t:CDS:2, partial [Racocetra persica]
ETGEDLWQYIDFPGSSQIEDSKNETEGVVEKLSVEKIVNFSRSCSSSSCAEALSLRKYFSYDRGGAYSEFS